MPKFDVKKYKQDMMDDMQNEIAQNQAPKISDSEQLRRKVVESLKNKIRAGENPYADVSPVQEGEDEDETVSPDEKHLRTGRFMDDENPDPEKSFGSEIADKEARRQRLKALKEGKFYNTFQDTSDEE